MTVELRADQSQRSTTPSCAFHRREGSTTVIRTAVFGKIPCYDVRVQGERQRCDWHTKSSSANSYWAHTKKPCSWPIIALNCPTKYQTTKCRQRCLKVPKSANDSGGPLPHRSVLLPGFTGLMKSSLPLPNRTWSPSRF